MDLILYLFLITAVFIWIFFVGWTNVPPLTDQIIISKQKTIKNKISSTHFCEPQKVVFLKNHKSGSTTVKHLLQKYALNHNFSMDLFLVGSQVGGYPNSFNSSLYLFGNKSKHTDVIYDHLRWNWCEIQKVLTSPKTHKRIAIIREPRAHFKSSFNFFYKKWTHERLAAKRETSRWNPDNCFGEPYSETNHQRLFKTIILA